MPSYNRANMIGITIESFIRQKYPADRYEIIVADNNSTDSTKEVVLGLAATSPIPITYLFEPRQGVHYARNMAAKQARGDILYFTDDDMIADSNLLDAIVRPFAMGFNVGSATGKVSPKWEVEPPAWILAFCNNMLLSLNNRQEELVVAPYDIGVFSCHQAITREAFFKSGGFNPENTAGEWIGDGETGLNIKLKNLGYHFAYVGAAIIYHMIPPTRLTQLYLNKRLANQGNSDSYTAYRLHRYTRKQLVRLSIYHLCHALRHYARYLAKWMLGRGSWRMELARSHYCKSRYMYDLRLSRDEDWRSLVLRDNWLDD
jgi:glycosyltransferase involved in cell wall biosynthesis